MSDNIVSLIFRSITPALVERSALALGCDRGSVSKAVLALVPSLLRLLKNRAGIPGGAASLAASLAGMQPETVGRLESLIGAHEQQTAVEHGMGMVSHLIGADATDQMIRDVATYAGMTQATGNALTAFVAPSVIGALATLARERKLESSGLTSFLQQQGGNIDAAMPIGFHSVQAAGHVGGDAAPRRVAGAAAGAAAAAAAAAAATTRTAVMHSATIGALGDVARADKARTDARARAAHTAPAAAAIAPLPRAVAAQGGLSSLLWLVPVAVLGLYGWWSLMDREATRSAHMRAAIANSEADSKARADAEVARVKAESEAKARADAEAARVRAETEAKARADAEAARVRAETEAKARADAEAARVRAAEAARSAEAKVRADAEAAKLRADQQAKADADARRKAGAEADAKARQAADARSKIEADAKLVTDLYACRASVTAAAKSGPMLFDVASDVISVESRATLNRLVSAIKGCASLVVRVEGHTDSDGDPAENQVLSERRATAVVTYLTGAGIAADRLTSSGFGASNPITANDTAAKKALNRRIEFIVTGR